MSLSNSLFFPTDRPFPAEIFIAFSGGRDSSVLLHKAWQQLTPLKIDVKAIHINHHLHPDANQWQQHCSLFCQKYKIPFQVVDAHVSQQSRKGLERRAREARFSAFINTLPKGAILTLAHHQQDQAETVLIKILRGGGVEALSGMQFFTSYKHFFLWRPLLGAKQKEIGEYATKNGLLWIEDSSNQDTNIRRNFLRKQVLPTLEQKWQGTSKRLANAAQWATDERYALHYFLNEQQKKSLVSPLPFSLLSLSKEALFSVPSEVAFLLFKHILKTQGIMRLKSHLQEIIKQAKKGTAEHILISERQKHVLCVREKNIDLYPWIDPYIKNAQVNDFLNQKKGQGFPDQWLSENPLSVRSRTGGERIWQKGQSQRLKSWYKQQKLPRCWRQQLPLIYAQDTIIGVWGVALFDHPTVKKDEKGWVFSWQKKDLKTDIPIEES